MHYFKIILIMLLISSCGKSPLFNKADKTIPALSGTIHEYAEGFPSEKIGFKIEWTVVPSLDELSSFNLILEKDLKSGQSITAYIWMPEMGHGSSPIEIKMISSTEIQFTELAFIMPGLWVLHLEINENNKVIDQWQSPISL